MIPTRNRAAGPPGKSRPPGIRARGDPPRIRSATHNGPPGEGGEA